MSQASRNFHWHPIPSSPRKVTCKLHLLQAGSIRIPKNLVFRPDDPKNDQDPQQPNDSSSFLAPDYCFLLHHPPSNKHYIFDLGIRKDLENLPPYICHNVLPSFPCNPKSPADILRQHGDAAQQPENIAAVIFSHMHFDHVGDGAKAGFTAAELWVGPTCCVYARPGYPVEQDGVTLSETLPTDGSRKIVKAFISDEVLEKAGDSRAGKVAEARARGLYEAVDLSVPGEKGQGWTALGAFDRAFDVFGDGALYVVDAPGHSAGHQQLLVRVKINEDDEDDDFVLLAGDCYHHPALLEDPERTARPPYSKASMHADPEVAIDTMMRTKAFHDRENVLVAGAHDFSIGRAIAPGEEEIEGLVCLNEWRAKGWRKIVKG